MRIKLQIVIQSARTKNPSKPSLSSLVWLRTTHLQSLQRLGSINYKCILTRHALSQSTCPRHGPKFCFLTLLIQYKLHLCFSQSFEFTRRQAIEEATQSTRRKDLGIPIQIQPQDLLAVPNLKDSASQFFRWKLCLKKTLAVLNCPFYEVQMVGQIYL